MGAACSAPEGSPNTTQIEEVKEDVRIVQGSAEHATPENCEKIAKIMNAAHELTDSDVDPAAVGKKHTNPDEVRNRLVVGRAPGGNEGQGILWLAFKGDEVVACCNATNSVWSLAMAGYPDEGKAERARVGLWGYLAVDPAHMNGGIASKLAKRAELDLLSRGCDQLQIEFWYTPGHKHSERLKGWYVDKLGYMPILPEEVELQMGQMAQGFFHMERPKDVTRFRVCRKFGLANDMTKWSAKYPFPVPAPSITIVKGEAKHATEPNCEKIAKIMNDAHEKSDSDVDPNAVGKAHTNAAEVKNRLEVGRAPGGNEGQGILWLAFLGDEVVGCCNATNSVWSLSNAGYPDEAPDPEEAKKERAKIGLWGFLAVDVAKQGLGIASKLAKKAEEDLLERGCEQLQIEFWYTPGHKHSERLKGWYMDKLGYVPILPAEQELQMGKMAQGLFHMDRPKDVTRFRICRKFGLVNDMQKWSAKYPLPLSSQLKK